VPIPYPNTSKAADLQDGTKQVLIGGKPAGVKDSVYKTSPLGNEAATRNFGGGVLSHTITGKTVFLAFSMNVQFEGKGVVRHLDLTGSNAGSPPDTPPGPNVESAAKPADVEEGEVRTCPCCGSSKHTSQQARTPMTTEEYYNPLAKNPNLKVSKLEAAAFETAMKTIAAARAAGCGAVVMHEKDSDPCAKHYATTKEEKDAADEEYNMLVSPMTPDEEFVKEYGEKLGGQLLERRAEIIIDRDNKKVISVAHKTPRSGGGCPIGAGNLANVDDKCIKFEKEMGAVQGTIAVFHRKSISKPK
jgi:hypothetical protein